MTSLSLPRWLALLLLFAAAPAVFGQMSLEERPEVKQLSREELERRKAEQTFRNAQTLFGLGVMRHRGDRWLEAVTLLEEAAKLDPQTPAAYRALVPLYLSLAREEDALVACRRVLQLDPADADAAFQLSKLLREDGRTREAIAALAQGVASPRIEDRSDLLYFMLSDLADLQEKAGDFPAAAASYRRMAKHLIDHQGRLVGSETLTPEQHAVAAAQAYEKVGQCLLQQKKFSEAVAAFKQSRDFLAEHADPQVRLKAVRLNWNLAQACLAQERWADALTYLDEYLENRPLDMEPYEKKVALLKRLNRGTEVVPALKRYASRTPDALGVQLSYARELAEDPRGRAEAQDRYLELAERFGTAEVYRGLFKFYQANGKMGEALNLIDQAFKTVTSKDDIAADVRERARDRGRAILVVLRAEPALVEGMLKAAGRAPSRLSRETLRLCAALAARAHQLDQAELLYRRCLDVGPLDPSIYGGLLEVLWLQRKHDAVIALCRQILDGPQKDQVLDRQVFHRSLALALSEKDKFDEALAEIDKAIKLADGTGKVLERCRKARILAQADRFEAAIAEGEATLKELVEADEIKQVRYALATIYLLKGEHDKSEAQLARILEDDTNDPEANNDLGYQWADRNRRLDEAEKMIRKAIEMDRLHRKDDVDGEDNAAYLDSLGWVMYRQGKLNEAREWLEKAVALPVGADDPTVWDHLADVYFKMKLADKAKEAWQRAIRLYDHDRRSQKEGRQEEAKRKLKLVSE
jgi:tetratricopeptide (TPR) repeat protein